MRSRARIGIVAIALVATSCGGTEDVTDSESRAVEDTVEASGGTTVGPDGGTVTSDDGVLTIDIPAGALDSAVDVGIAVVPAEDVGLTPDLVSQPVYELSPDGAAFDVPVAVTRTLSAAELGIAADAVPFVSMFQGRGSDWTVLSTQTSRSGDEVLVRTEVDHFSANVAVASTEVWGYGLELTMRLEPGSFTTPVGSSAEVGWSTRAPSLSPINVSERGSHDGALAGFAKEQFEWIATCGDDPGTGNYTIELDGLVQPREVEDFALTGPDAFFEAFFGALPNPTPFTIAATGTATCTDASADAPDQTDQSSDLDLASAFQGSFGGAISFESLLDDTAYDSDYLLSVLDPASADAVLTDASKLITAQIGEIIRDTIGGGLDPTIILSQIGPDGVGQNTFGAAAERGGGAIRVFTASTEASYAEFYILDLTFCDGFPANCQDISLDVITVGGAADLDVARAFDEMLEYMMQLDRTAIFGGPYEWAFEGSGTLTRESGTPGS
jgi:hypothetical protein